MAKSFLVIGLGRFGASLACALAEAGHHVLGVDCARDVVQALAGRLTHVVQIARALIETQKEVLSLVEADEAIQPEMDTGVRLARRLVTPNILEYLTLGPEISLAEVQAPTFMASKTLSELDIRRRYGVTVLVIKNSGPWLGGIRTSPS